MTDVDNTQPIYPRTVRGRVMRGGRRGLAVLQLLITQIPAHMTASLSNLLLAQTLTYLQFTQPSGVMFGLRMLNWLPWWVVVGTFMLCGWILAQPRPVAVYIACHLPMLAYGGVVAWGVLVNDSIGALGLLPLQYLIIGSIAILHSLVLQDRVTLLERQVNQVESKLDEEAGRWKKRLEGNSSTT